MKSAILLVLCAGMASAEVHKNPGSASPLPSQKYVHVVPQAESPVQQTYVKTKDGLYVASAIRKPKGSGRYPAIIFFHGAPGGRGMDELVSWSRGDTGGPVWERFLREGYVTVVADYRGGSRTALMAPGAITPVDDALAIVEHVKSLPYVDPNRVTLFGGSLGGYVVLGLLSRVQVDSAILGAPAAMMFLGMRPSSDAGGAEAYKDLKVDPAVARKNIEPVHARILILVGTADRLQPVAVLLHDQLAAAGKSVRLEIYENGYHGFYYGPQGHKRPNMPQGEPLLDSTLDALEKSVLFVKGRLK